MAWPALDAPVSWKHHLVGVAPGGPGRSTTLAVVEQVVARVRAMTLETLELRQSHLEQVPAGTGLVETALKRVGGYGPREPKVAGAAVHALSRMDDEASLAQLARLAGRVTHNTTRTKIGRAS